MSKGGRRGYRPGQVRSAPRMSSTRPRGLHLARRAAGRGCFRAPRRTEAPIAINLIPVTISSTSRADYQTFATSHRADFERWLAELVNIPTVSVDPARAADVRRCAESARARLQQLG